MSRVSSYLNDFEEAGFIISCNTQATLFVPARPLDQIKLTDVLAVLYGADEVTADVDTLGEAVAMEFFKGGEEPFKELTLENLLERI